MLLEIRRHIRRQTIADLTRYRGSPPLAVEVRLAQLDREWNVARAIKAGATSFALAGIALGVLVHPRWLLMPAAVVGLALQLRHSRLRSQTEIEAERRVLRIMKFTAS
jgi:hypothetical protein